MVKLEDNISALLEHHRNRLPIGANETFTIPAESQQSITSMKIGTQEINNAQ